jgi:hypothetical protein
LGFNFFDFVILIRLFGIQVALACWLSREISGSGRLSRRTQTWFAVWLDRVAFVNERMAYPMLRVRGHG